MSIDIHLYVSRDTICRSTYTCMSVEILYVDRHTHVCQSRYYMSVDIHMYVNRDTVCRSTYSISIDILFDNRDTVCRSRYCMTIGSSA